MPVFNGGSPPSGGFVGNVVQTVGHVFHKVVQEAAPAAKGTAFSLGFLLLLLLFLLVHWRIDRRDPKLANAPLLPNVLYFQAPRPGGSHDLG